MKLFYEKYYEQLKMNNDTFNKVRKISKDAADILIANGLDISITLDNKFVLHLLSDGLELASNEVRMIKLFNTLQQVIDWLIKNKSQIAAINVANDNDYEYCKNLYNLN